MYTVPPVRNASEKSPDMMSIPCPPAVRDDVAWLSMKPFSLSTGCPNTWMPSWRAVAGAGGRGRGHDGGRNACGEPFQVYLRMFSASAAGRGGQLADC